MCGISTCLRSTRSESKAHSETLLRHLVSHDLSLVLWGAAEGGEGFEAGSRQGLIGETLILISVFRNHESTSTSVKQERLILHGYREADCV